MYDFNMRRCCLAQLIVLDISRIEQNNNVDNDFTEDARTFLHSYFQSSLDKSFWRC